MSAQHRQQPDEEAGVNTRMNTTGEFVARIGPPSSSPTRPWRLSRCSTPHRHVQLTPPQTRVPIFKPTARPSSYGSWNPGSPDSSSAGSATNARRLASDPNGAPPPNSSPAAGPPSSRPPRPDTTQRATRPHADRPHREPRGSAHPAPISPPVGEMSRSTNPCPRCPRMSGCRGDELLISGRTGLRFAARRRPNPGR